MATVTHLPAGPAEPPKPRDSGTADDVAYVAWKEWAAEAFGQFSNLDAAYFAAEVPMNNPASVRVLELGFGNGAFLGWAHALGAETYGVEANAQLVVRANELIGDSHAFSSSDAPELDARRGTFTHIVAFDVLEHIPQSNYPALFRRFAELLAPGGHCTLRFPNGDSPFARGVQHGDPTHVTTVGRAKLVYFAEQAGLRVESVRAPALPISGLGWRRAFRRRVVLAGRFALESLVGYLYFGQRVPLDQNYTAVLSRPALKDPPALEPYNLR